MRVGVLVGRGHQPAGAGVETGERQRGEAQLGQVHLAQHGQPAAVRVLGDHQVGAVVAGRVPGRRPGRRKRPRDGIGELLGGAIDTDVRCPVPEDAVPPVLELGEGGPFGMGVFQRGDQPGHHLGQRRLDGARVTAEQIVEDCRVRVAEMPDEPARAVQHERHGRADVREEVGADHDVGVAFAVLHDGSAALGGGPGLAVGGGRGDGVERRVDVLQLLAQDPGVGGRRRHIGARPLEVVEHGQGTPPTGVVRQPVHLLAQGRRGVRADRDVEAPGHYAQVGELPQVPADVLDGGPPGGVAPAHLGGDGPRGPGAVAARRDLGEARREHDRRRAGSQHRAAVQAYVQREHRRKVAAQPEVVGERAGQGLHGPVLEHDDAVAHEARPRAQPDAPLAGVEDAPGRRTEEADRLVLGVVPLQVLRQLDLAALAALVPHARLTAGLAQPVDHGVQEARVLPDEGLAHSAVVHDAQHLPGDALQRGIPARTEPGRRAGIHIGQIGQPRALWFGEGRQSRQREPGTAQAEVAPHQPARRAQRQPQGRFVRRRVHAAHPDQPLSHKAHPADQSVAGRGRREGGRPARGENSPSLRGRCGRGGGRGHDGPASAVRRMVVK
ncbi:hypothetical protein Prum_011300 [Phytohabitans rumicis]|uniref:Uncharacterized protein n=1 Tax=Phytohabitans rumicis TaxID=1076125 RepID=A0A6V8KXS2_9ACTN|nr:hypothetical protein [Phytohabitans rumicis]GFJ87488.1 hypothetical protein Prum_011300 [Phytohabitans rumicis]